MSAPRILPIFLAPRLFPLSAVRRGRATIRLRQLPRPTNIRWYSTPRQQHLVVTDPSSGEQHALSPEYLTNIVTTWQSGQPPPRKLLSIWKLTGYGTLLVLLVLFATFVSLDGLALLRVISRIGSLRTKVEKTVRANPPRQPTDMLHLLRKLAPYYTARFPEHRAFVEACLADFDYIYDKYAERLNLAFWRCRYEQLKLVRRHGYTDLSKKRFGTAIDVWAFDLLEIGRDVAVDILQRHPRLQAGAQRIVAERTARIVVDHTWDLMYGMRGKAEKWWEYRCDELSRAMNEKEVTSETSRKREEEAVADDLLLWYFSPLLGLVPFGATVPGDFAVFGGTAAEKIIQSDPSQVSVEWQDPSAMSHEDRILFKVARIARLPDYSGGEMGKVSKQLLTEIEQLLERAMVETYYKGQTGQAEQNGKK